jgi:hypothetical protein
MTEAGPIRKILTHLGEPLEPAPVSPARGPPAAWAEFVQIHNDRDVFQATDRRTARDRHPQPLTGVGHEASKPRERQTGTRSSRREIVAEVPLTGLSFLEIEGMDCVVVGLDHLVADGIGDERMAGRADLLRIPVGELADRRPADGILPHGELRGEEAADAPGLVGGGVCARSVAGGRRGGGAGGGKERAASKRHGFLR